MRWFGNLSIFKKLMLAFLLSGTFTAALGALALIRLQGLDDVVNDMNENWMPGMRIMLDMKATLAEYRIAEIQLVNRSDDSVLPDYQKRIKEFRDHIQSDLDDYRPLVGDGDEKKLSDAVDGSVAAYLKLSDDIIAAAVAHNTADASAKLTGDSKKLRRQAADAIDAAAKYNVTHSFAIGQQVTHDYRNARIALIIGTLLTVGIGLALGTLIARGVQKPLKIAADTANAISQGILDRHIEATTTDEAGSLLASMKMMQSRLQSFIAGLGTMAERHQAGEISHRVPADQLAGAYARMAEQVNSLVASHIAVSSRVVEVVQRYAEGDFSVDMDRLPGEQARITDSINAVRQSFVCINEEILKLVNAAAQGNFSARGDVARYSNDFARMVEGLNRLMEISDSGLRALTGVLAGMSSGDLTLQMEGEFAGAFAELQKDTNKTVDQLRSIVSDIKSTTASINSAAVQINAGNADLSSRTEAQAASLEEAASSMEELTSTVRQNADSARQGNLLAIGASEVASKGGKAVSEVVETMHSINQSSRKIVEIISVIDGIAFQTNILALNAAVEAARAGEQGRGFAVVASEVRTLAQRSAAAAREIKALITDSVGQIESGTRLVEVAGSTMEEIQSAVKRVTDLMAEISAASAEQTAGIEQVNITVTHMDNATQQNAALVEECTSATESMAEQAQKLTGSVAVFRLDRQPALRVVKTKPDRASSRAVQAATV